MEDLLAFGQGLDLAERPVADEEVGRRAAELAVPVLAVVRAGRTLRYADPTLGVLQPADRIIYVATEELGGHRTAPR